MTITDRQTSDLMMASNTTHVRNDTVVTFNCINSAANFLAGSNLQFTTALKDGSGNRFQVLYANGDAAWG